MKKILALILSALMLGMSLLACSDTVGDDTASGNNAAEETAAEDTSGYVSDDLGEANFDGYSYRILSAYYWNKELAHYIMFDELTGDPVNDELFKSKTNVEERFNVSISYIETGDDAAVDTAARTSITGGDDAFDIMLGNDFRTFALGTEGMMLNLMDIEQFNMEKPWWPANTIEALRFGNQLYAASSYLSYCGLHWTRAMTVNKDLADNWNIEIPYNAVREGKWTLDMLHSMTEGTSWDIDGNGKINANDEVGFVSGSQTWYCMQVAADVPIYRKDANHYPYIDLNIERAQKYAEIMNKLVNGNDYVESSSFGEVMFGEGRALFAYTQVGNAYDQFRTQDVRYGFLPTPKLDEIQEEYINCCTDVPWAIPKTVSGDQVAIVGTITEAMSCYNYNYVLPAYYEGAIKARLADAPDDSEMIQLISDTRSISFGYSYNLGLSNFTSQILSNSNVASLFESQEKVITSALEELILEYQSME